jgi:hypothetical protein
MKTISYCAETYVRADDVTAILDLITEDCLNDKLNDLQFFCKVCDLYDEMKGLDND